MTVSSRLIAPLLAVAAFAASVVSTPALAAVEQPRERNASRSRLTPVQQPIMRPVVRGYATPAAGTQRPWFCNSFLCGRFIVLGIGF